MKDATDKSMRTPRLQERHIDPWRIRCSSIHLTNGPSNNLEVLHEVKKSNTLWAQQTPTGWAQGTSHTWHSKSRIRSDLKLLSTPSIDTWLASPVRVSPSKFILGSFRVGDFTLLVISSLVRRSVDKFFFSISSLSFRIYHMSYTYHAVYYA